MENKPRRTQGKEEEVETSAEVCSCVIGLSWLLRIAIFLCGGSDGGQHSVLPSPSHQSDANKFSGLDVEFCVPE